MQQAMSAPQPHFVSIHRAISWAMSLLKVQLNICTKATLRADESGCCGEVGGGGKITIFWGVHVYCAQLMLTICPRLSFWLWPEGKWCLTGRNMLGRSAKVPKAQVCIGLQVKNRVQRVRVLGSGFYCTEKWYRSVVYEFVYKRFLCVYWKAQMDLK